MRTKSMNIHALVVRMPASDRLEQIWRSRTFKDGSVTLRLKRVSGAK